MLKRVEAMPKEESPMATFAPHPPNLLIGAFIFRFNKFLVSIFPMPRVEEIWSYAMDPSTAIFSGWSRIFFIENSLEYFGEVIQPFSPGNDSAVTNL